jgi:hypothetical protein
MIEVYLYTAEPNPFDIILAPLGIRPFVLGKRTKAIFVPVPDENPPVAQSLYASLAEQYGDEKGKVIWARMLVERKGPFAEGALYDPAKPEVAEALVEASLILPTDNPAS